MAAKKNFYAVRNGKTPGIYKTWAECQREVVGFKGAVFKGFVTLPEAEAFMQGVDTSLPAADGVAVYVDGSYFNGQYSWGLAAYRDGELVYQGSGLGSSPEAAQHHNVAGEIEAAMQAVKWAESEGIDDFTIFHDYQGVSEWAEGCWKTNTEATKAYAEFMRPYRGRVKFRKVAGHTGVKGNELADKLAKQALGID